MRGRAAGYGRRATAVLAGFVVAACGPTKGHAQTSSDGGAGPVSRRVAITFDDLPANSFRPGLEAFRRVTGPLVAGLARHEIPAIGFVNESKLYVDGELREERVRLLGTWVEAGLELGNHSYSHPDLHSTPLDAYERDVLRGEEVTRRLLATVGRLPRFFRHPFLHTGTSLEVRDAFDAFLAEHGYRVAPVTIDNQEWIFARAYDHALARHDDALADRIADSYLAYMDGVFAYYEAQSVALLGREIRQVLLVHANQLNADRIDRLLGLIEARGYAFIPLDEALEDPAYEHTDEYAGTGGITWLHRWALTEGKRGEFFAGEPEVPAFVQAVFDDPPAPDGGAPLSGRGGIGTRPESAPSRSGTPASGGSGPRTPSERPPS